MNFNIKKYIKIFQMVVLIMIIPTFAFSLNFKLNVGKITSNTGSYEIGFLNGDSATTNQQPTNDFNFSGEVILYGYFSLGLGLITNTGKYSVNYDGRSLVAFDTKTYTIISSKSYLFEHIKEFLITNYYIGIDYILIQNKFSLTDPSSQSVTVEEFDESFTSNGTGLSFGAEIMFHSSGLRLEYTLLDVSGVKNSVNDISVRYELKGAAYTIGVLLYI